MQWNDTCFLGAQGEAEDELHDERVQALEAHDLPRQHMLRQGPLSLRLLPALAIMAADHEQLQQIISGTAPLQVGDKHMSWSDP